MTTTLAQNLAALRNRGYDVPDDPRLPPGWDLQIEAPGPTLRLPGPTGTPIAAHSSRAPAAEAERLIAALEVGPTQTVAALLGVGLGFVVEALDAQHPTLPVVAVETTFDRLVPFLSRRDWTVRITKGTLGVFSLDTTTNSPGVRRLLERRQGDLLQVAHPVLGHDRPDLIAATAALERVWLGARANREARLMFEGPYADQTLRNLARIPALVDVRELAGRESRRPAVVVAAGPSLDRQLDDIRTARDRFCLIAVDTALRPLLAAGIDPDYVVAVDPSETNARHLVDVACGSHARLVAELSLPGEVFAAFTGRTIGFRVGLNEPWPWLVQHGVDVGILAAWGSVLFTTIDFACHLGCNPILLTGADLAYTGDRPYCRGTTFGRDWIARGGTEDTLAAGWMEARDRDLVTVPDLHGAPTRTPSYFLAVRDGLAELAARKRPTRLINTTDAGILAGTAIEQMTLASALAMLPISTATSTVSQRPRLILPEPAREDAPAWQAIERALIEAWPHLADRQGLNPRTALRALVMARHGTDGQLPVAGETCVRWLAPLFDSPWTAEVLQVVQALEELDDRWYERLEPGMRQGLAEGEVEVGTYLRYAWWIIRNAGDRLYLPPRAPFVSGVADRLGEYEAGGPLGLVCDAERVLLLAGLGRITDATPLLDRLHRHLPDRPIVSEAMIALSIGARAAALIPGAARLAPGVASTAQTWAAWDLDQQRDTALTFQVLVHTAACSGDVEAARAYLARGLARHPAMRERCAVLALEAWLSDQHDLAAELLQRAAIPMTPRTPQMFQTLVAEALFGDPDRARDYLHSIDLFTPAYFTGAAPPNNRWFLLARAAEALDDEELASQAWRAAERYDPLVRQRQQLAPRGRPVGELR
jgi:hypothetical protein